MLMRAGIGPGEHLTERGIEVVADRAGRRAEPDGPPDDLGLGIHEPVARGCAKAQRRHIFLGMRWSSGVADCPPADMYAVAYNRGAWHPVGWRIGGFLTWINKSYSRGYGQAGRRIARARAGGAVRSARR